MATRLAYEALRAALGTAAERLLVDARAAGVTAPVPTCPGWTVADLLVHLGAVHRWATAHASGLAPRGSSGRFVGDAARTDPWGWLEAGVAPLLAALDAMAADADAYVFILDAPPPRLFWARRQAHETTVHALDAIAAATGRLLETSDPAASWIDPAVAEDGIDELVSGILPQPHWRLRSQDPYRLGLRADDTGRAWTVAVGPGPAVTTDGLIEPVDAMITGSAVELYVGVWNRSSGLAVSGRPELAAAWREALRVG